MNTKILVAAFALALLAACHGKDPQAEARAQAAQAAAQEAAATDAAKAFDAAVAQQNWRLAKAQGDVLVAQFPQSQAAQRVRAQMDEVKAKSDAARESERTAALWSYDKEAVQGG
jgi:type IV pilus biogenesis protein CpaD/CtpE